MNPVDDTGTPTEASGKTLRSRLTHLLSQLLTLRAFAIFLVSVLVFSIAYYLVFALPKHNRAREKFEATQETKREKEYKEELAKIDADYRAEMLQSCIAQAEENYWDYIKLAGKEKPGKKGVYWVTDDVSETARKKKKDALDECHRQWDPK